MDEACRVVLNGVAAECVVVPHSHGVRVRMPSAEWVRFWFRRGQTIVVRFPDARDDVHMGLLSWVAVAGGGQTWAEFTTPVPVPRRMRR